MLKITLFLVLSFEAMADSGGVIYLSDLEGSYDRVQSLIDAGELRRDANGSLEIVDPTKRLIFGGDLFDRGPHSIQLRQELMALKAKYQDRVTFLWGNRDLNKLDLAATLVRLRNGPEQIPDYQEWLLSEHKAAGGRIPGGRDARQTLAASLDSEAKRILWWGGEMGAPQILEFHQEEMAARGRRAVSLEEAGVDLAKSLDPKNGELFQFLMQGQMGVIDGKVAYVHAGFNRYNRGVVPESESVAILSPQDQIKALNEWGQKEIREIQRSLIAGEVNPDLRLVRYGDGAWDSSVRKLFKQMVSIVYPLIYRVKGTFRLPDTETRRWLLDNGITTVVVGHSPAGNIPMPLREDGLLYFYADTSYAANGGKALVHVNGEKVSVKGMLGDGTKINYTISPNSPGPIGRLYGDFIVNGITEDGLLSLFRYEGFDLDEMTVPQELISELSLRAPVEHANEEAAQQRRALAEGLMERNFRLYDGLRDVEQEFADRIPVLISLPDGFDFKLGVVKGEERTVEKIEAWVDGLLDAMDPDKHLLITPGADQGMLEILHARALARGFPMVGFTSDQRQPNAFESVKNIFLAGQSRVEAQRRAIDFVRSRGGHVLLGGGDERMQRIVEYARQVHANFSIAANIGGYTQNAADDFPLRAHKNVAEFQQIFANPPRYYGRILRGKTLSDFETTSDDVDRRIVMFMDEAGLDKLAGLEGEDLLRAVGYPEETIRELVEKGTTFKLFTFEDNGQMIRADWDGLLAMLKRDYPPAVWQKVEAQLPRLKLMSFAEIEASTGANFKGLKALGKTDPRYINADRLAQSDGSLWQVRAFLYNELNLNELFAGDGFTRLPDGTIGVAEYFDKKRSLVEYAGVELRNLTTESRMANLARKIHEAWLKRHLADDGKAREKPVPLTPGETAESEFIRYRKLQYPGLRIDEQGVLVQDIVRPSSELVPALNLQLNGNVAEGYVDLISKLKLETAEDFRKALAQGHSLFFRFTEGAGFDEGTLDARFRNLPATDKLKEFEIFKAVLEDVNPELAQNREFLRYANQFQAGIVMGGVQPGAIDVPRPAAFDLPRNGAIDLLPCAVSYSGFTKRLPASAVLKSSGTAAPTP